ncbi:calcium-transporting P-type ATPase, PMR1-type [Batrachochytrium salamandrivorans]|nr:calcium-transporting P-type ATPase, PMR1-type [Batrachochytrium salamandrivorans]
MVYPPRKGSPHSERNPGRPIHSRGIIAGAEQEVGLLTDTDAGPTYTVPNDTSVAINNAVFVDNNSSNDHGNNSSNRSLTRNNSASHFTRNASSSPLSVIFAICTAHATLDRQGVNKDIGLDSSEVIRRRLEYGSNELIMGAGESIYVKFLEQFQNPLILLLLASAVVSVLLGNIQDAISITLAIVIVLTVAFIQEYQSEQSLEALNKLAPPYCHVKRCGEIQKKLASELVPGDIIIFERGDRVPADVRLFEAVHLDIDESSLTGENEPTRKQVDELKNTVHDIPLNERTNIAFMGSLVRNGHGKGVVIATGKSTELGVVFCMMSEVETRRTPLQTKMDTLGKQLSAASFGFIGIIMLMGVLQGRNWLEMFTVGVSLAVAAIPEGLPIVVTVTLALGVLRMASKHTIVKKLPSVESLGSVNVVCVDKTGTLTMNMMRVTQLFTLAQNVPISVEHKVDSSSMQHPAILQLLRISNLCNNAHRDHNDKLVGQPSEVAMLEFYQRFGRQDARLSEQRISETPFNAERKWMMVESRSTNSGSSQFYIKGALEPILELCSSYYISETVVADLDHSRQWDIKNQERHIAQYGLRVLALAYGDVQDKLIFVGLIAMYDPPRPGISDTIRGLMECSIKVVMLTGDSEGTAKAIAAQIGIPVNSRSVMSGAEIDSTCDADLKERISSISIFYRMSPIHKLTIIRAHQAAGSIVAMTGDGVNDAPALRLADIGISMGKTGTDVAKEAADMILVNDDLSTVISAIEEGKNIFHNIQHFLCFQLSTSASALLLIALSTFMNLENPLNAMQILWINIICDGPVAQSLGVESANPEIMKHPPRNKEEPIITKDLIMRIAINAAIIVTGTLALYVLELKEGVVTTRGRTMTFTCFVFFDMWNSLGCRSSTRLIYHVGLLTNRMYTYAVSACVLGQLLVVYVPFLQTVFQTSALSLFDLVYLLVATSVVFWIDEGRKVFAGYTKKPPSHSSDGYA